MDVILLERIEKLGQMGQVVKVKPGFARNFLLPKKKALRATKDNLAYFEGQRVQLEARNLELRKEAEGVAGKVNGLSVTVIRQAAETGVLYGSVSSRDVADAVSAQGVAIQRTQVAIADPIKTLGLFKVKIVLHPEVAVFVTVNVARSVEEAATQAQRGGVVIARDDDEAAEGETVADETAVA
jgi:large subunit ribosomal protein L9